MLARLGFSKRLVALILLVLFAAWALGTGSAFVWISGREKPPALPFPEQAAAVVELIDDADPTRRELALKAVSSEAFSVEIVREKPAEPPGRQRVPVIEWYIAQYLEAVGTRDVTVSMEDEPASAWGSLRFGQYWIYARKPLRIAISLKSGGFAVFETRGELSRRLFGLPAGFWLGTIGALIGAGAILALMREAKPLRDLASLVSRFATDATPERMTPRGAPEIRALILAVNDMQSRIAALVRGRTVLLGAISHDLKTYLTRLRLRVEAIDDDARRDKATQDIDAMTHLIEDALAIARGAVVSDRREPVDVAGLVTSELASRDDPRVTFAAQPARPTLIAGDPMALKRLMSNLIDNALRYGTRCCVSLSADPNSVSVLVDDDGPGIPEADRAAVFEPFYRLEVSRNRETGGAGLGLAIVRQIVEAHGGTIAVATSPAGGARFEITFPAAGTG